MKRNSGADFEAEVFLAVKSALSRRYLGLDPHASRVLHHPSYYSRDRGSEIIVDIAVELVLPGAKSPSILWIWECKNYQHRIAVDEVEEFHAKLQQIGADRTKGTLITRSTFQQSTLAYAASKGIGLARLMPDEEIAWVLHNLTSKDLADLTQEVGEALLLPDYQAFSCGAYAYTSASTPLAKSSLDGIVVSQLAEWGFEPDGWLPEE